MGDVVGWIDGWMDGGVIQGAEAVNLNSRLSLHLICMPKSSSYVYGPACRPLQRRRELFE